MDPRFEELIAYLRGHKLARKDTAPSQFADYLEQEIRPLLEAEAMVPVKRGPGRPRKEDAACV